MNFKNRITASFKFLVLVIPAISQAGDHPTQIMTKAGVERIRAELGEVPLFDAT